MLPLMIHIFAPIGLIVLLPLDATGGFLDDQNGVPALSMANLSKHSNRLWVHAIYAVFCTFLTFYFLYRLYAKVFYLQEMWADDQSLTWMYSTPCGVFNGLGKK
jgi:hypothetical protein